MVTKKTRSLSLLLSLVLVASLIVVPASATFAPTAEEVQASALLRDCDDAQAKNALNTEAVASDLAIFAERLGPTNQMSIVGIDACGNAIYAAPEPEFDTIDYLSTWTGDDGSTYIHVTEGNLENTIQFTPNGALFIDGKQVTFSTCDEIADAFPVLPSATPRAGMVSYFYTTPQGGTTADEYNTGRQTVFKSIPSVEFEKTVSAMTVKAIKSALIAAAPGLLGVIGATMFNYLAEGLIASMRQHDPDTQAISFKDYRKMHPTNSSTQGIYYRHDVYYYSQKNFNGSCWLARQYYEARVPT